MCKYPPRMCQRGWQSLLINNDRHPFWHIRRSSGAGTFNSAVVGLEIKAITSSGMSELQTADNTRPKALWDYVVTVPCIVNTKQIACGEEIVLKWGKVHKGKFFRIRPQKRDSSMHSLLGTAKKTKNLVDWSFRDGGPLIW